MAAATLTSQQIAIVKSTAPVLKEHGTAITTLFYQNMLAANPALHNIFNVTSQVTGAQPRALAAAVFAYASYVDDLAKLTAAVERIAHKHISLNVQPDQYAIVGKFLLEAVATVLGDGCTPEIAEAWTAAYAVLAGVFINREQQLYGDCENWTGWRKFKIQRKVVQSSEITSFYLVPEDGAALPRYLPGQYLSIRMFLPQLGHMQPRQYSLSDAPRSDYYRISVKKEKGQAVGVAGLISNMLHDDFKEGDVVEITHPAGDFFVDMREEGSAPLVLISAGVGVTPMISILNSTVAADPKRRVSFIHGVHSTERRAFADHVTEISSKNPNMYQKIFVSKPGDQDVQGVDYDLEGRIDLNRVDAKGSLFVDDACANYYVCGPNAFMADVQKYLLNAGVTADRIHLEVFGVGN